MIDLRKVHFYSLLISCGIGVCILLVLIFREIFVPIPAARQTVGVLPSEEYRPATEAAMRLWNGYVGCEFFVNGATVRVKAEDGEPCGMAWPDEHENVGGAAFQCPNGLFDVLIAYPGDLHQQTYIIAHELGHVIGERHYEKGVMSTNYSPNAMLTIGDDAVQRAHDRFCK